MLNNYLHEKKELFEKIFQRYVPTSHDDEEPLVHDQGFHVFLKKIFHIVSSNFYIAAEADIVMQHAPKRGEIVPGITIINTIARILSKLL